ncbi:hypothetical protein SAMN02745146_2729 [Hymenobacter daecheongensis DSM 21074]|uniref:Uncharacterized protein n=1 Tax=Hymenobacter daecheongensis DSM 21074 TaxID=1121955 RepID=A0A1M6I0E5_9BACT|nr:hypothetical protein [Hymenobacter daecheongensis]SHJ27851.1 hypothetical protein SAMN02745146_2729 [Hymenobacter daecheongensis DSM 21074]
MGGTNQFYLIMLNVQLANAGFYEIATPDHSAAGVTLVRPGRREAVRVFLPYHSPEVEVYAGSVKEGRLVYQGPAEIAAQLPLLAVQRN